jgi:hypothetical protein
MSDIFIESCTLVSLMMPRNPDAFDLKRDILIDPVTVEFNIGVHVMAQHRTLNTGVVDIPHDLYPLQGHPPAYTRYITVAKFEFGTTPTLDSITSSSFSPTQIVRSTGRRVVESYSHMNSELYVKKES